MSAPGPIGGGHVDEPQDLDESFFPIIGRIAVYAARIEHIADTVLSELVSHLDWQRVHVLTYGQQVSWVLDQIEALDKGECTKTDQTTLAMAWVVDVRRVLKLRNTVLHSVWFPGLLPNGDLYGIGSVRGRTTGEGISVTRMAEISTDLREVWLSGRALNARLAGSANAD